MGLCGFQRQRRQQKAAQLEASMATPEGAGAPVHVGDDVRGALAELSRGELIRLAVERGEREKTAGRMKKAELVELLSTPAVGTPVEIGETKE